MPVCLHCDRRFLNKDALHQHIASSSIPHPFCDLCDRRFISQAACDAHMSAKHPPTYDCLMCSRTFTAPFALEDHYRGSTAHPNCAKCGKGFKGLAERTEHQKTAHPLVPCDPCGGAMVYGDTLGEHYAVSPNHPTCAHCHRGLKDDADLKAHIAHAHPEFFCCGQVFDAIEDVQKHLFDSPMHKKCIECRRGFKDDAEFTSHTEAVHRKPIAPPVDAPGLQARPLKESHSYS